MSLYSGSLKLNEPEIKTRSVLNQTRYYSESCIVENKNANANTETEQVANSSKEDEIFTLHREISEIIKEGFKSEWAPEWKQAMLLNRLSNVVDKAKSQSLDETSLNKLAFLVESSTQTTSTLPLEKKSLIRDLLKGRVSAKHFFRMVCHSWSSKF